MDYGDQAELGPLRIGAASRFLLCVGSTSAPPEFRVRIMCRAGADSWPVSKFLKPRPGLQDINGVNAMY